MYIIIPNMKYMYLDVDAMVYYEYIYKHYLTHI